MGDNIFVKLASVPMVALFMKQILGFVIGPIKIFSDFNGHFHVYALSVYFDLYLYDFSVLYECFENPEKKVGGKRQQVEEPDRNKKMPDGRVSRWARGS